MRHKRKKLHHLTKDIVIGTIALGFILGGILVLWVSSFKIPDLSSLQERRVSQSTKIYDRTGEVLLYDVHEDVRRTVVPFDKISRNIKNATVAIEDTEFYQHKGVRLMATFRAVFIQPLRGKGVQGGSTITQQVVKNTILTSEKAISRKLKEWVLAVKLERMMDKDEILALYLNESPYGGNVYGIQEATRLYFGKNADEVTLAEAAYLAALPNAPTYYSPYGNNVDKLEERKNLVLKRMLESTFITEEEYEGALAEKVEFKPQQKTGIAAPHFVLFVKEHIEERYGPRAVSDEGLKVITTLDYNLQTKAEEIIKRYAEQNEKNFNAANAGLVAIDPKTGDILAMVGSRDYFSNIPVPEGCTPGVNCRFDPNFNITLAKRQPGSSFKPFVYATALMKGYTPDTVVFDLSTEFSTYCNPDGTPIYPKDADKCYQPVNFDGKYRGPVTMRNALAQSINIPAIKFLYLAGIRDSLQTARDMGITTLINPDQYGLTLVLGGGEVTLLEMTSSYSVFANKGVRNPYRAILEVSDHNGNVLEKGALSPQQVLDKKIALQITDILSDNEARAPEFGENSALNFPGYDVADKTGTTNDYRDAWIVGYTPSIAAGAWAGNNDNSPMEKKIAGFIIAPLWHEFMEAALASSSPEDRFEPPPEEDTSLLKPILRGLWRGNTSYFIDEISGKRATEYTPPETKVEKVITDVHSILHWVDRNNPLGPTPYDPTRDPQYPYWEYAVRKWVSQNNMLPETESVVPTQIDDVHTPANIPRITINGIDSNAGYPPDSIISISASGQGRFPLTKVDFFLNDQFLGSSARAPFTLSFNPSEFGGANEINSLKAVGYDAVYNKGEIVVALRLRQQ